MLRVSLTGIVVSLGLCAGFAHAGPIPVTYTSAGSLDQTSGTDYFGWSGKTISISASVSTTTPSSVTNLANGGVQDVYNALISITGFQANQAGTMTLTWNPGAGGSDSVSVAMTYSNFGMTTTVTETLNNVTMSNATPNALLNDVLTSPFDQITVTSNWGEHATFGVDGNMTTANGIANVATAPEPASFFLLAAGLGLTAWLVVRRRRSAKA